MRGESRLRMRPTRGVPRVLSTDHQERTKGYRLPISAIRASPFSKGMPTRMNGISAHYKIVGLLDR